MSEWYYARGGTQNGPVSLEQLREIARNGGLDPAKDLVWTSTMKDWTPAAQVPDLFTAPATPQVPPADPTNPYATPQSAWLEATPAATGTLQEIVPGSEPIRVGDCVRRGFELTTRHFGIIFLVGLTYFCVAFGASLILGMIDAAFGVGHSYGHWQTPNGNMRYTFQHYQQDPSLFHILASNLLSSFLALGVSRIGLNLVSGKAVSVGMLFGEGRKLLRAFVATILFALMVGLGLILLIVPGIYLALRFGQYMLAIVDRDMGIMEAFNYSSTLTTNNRVNLLLLALLCILIALAGMIACFVGLIFAIPVAWLSNIVAYRWMQYGHRAAMDQPGTQSPMLAGI